MVVKNETVSGKLKNTIMGIVPAGVKDKVSGEIESMDTVELFLWLTKQDPSLLYYISLALDIPLQHFDHTCSTLKQIHHQHC